MIALARSRRALGALGALFFLSVPAHAQRPAPGTLYEQQADLQSVASPGGAFRVWYATNTQDAVDPTDTAPQDGVPDFAAEVAVVADETHEILVNGFGFRPPLIDAEYSAPADVGGDARFDIYLWNYANADGQYEVDGCLDSPEWCTGYVVMENDFVGFNYPSIPLAIRVLVSHEYFHAVQAAYDAGQDIKWTEGTAVWAEEKVYPEQSDYEKLVAYFLEKPFRAFDRPSGASFGDLYQYGAALWPTFLDERFGPDIVREIWEACDVSTGQVRDFLTATDDLLKSKYGSNLVDAWLEFTQWNLFTGDRADPARAYERGADLIEVLTESVAAASDQGLIELAQQTEGMSARYTPIALPDLGGEPRLLSIVTESGTPAVGTAYLWQNGIMGEAIALEPDAADPRRASAVLSWQGTPLLYLVVTGVGRGSPMRTVTISMTVPTEPITNDEGGCQISRTSSSSSPGWMVLVLGAAWLGAGRSPRRSRARAR